VLAVISCALGMASKESMVTAPFMILMYDRIFVFDTFKEAWRRRWPFYVSLAATWAVLAALIWSGPRFRSAGFSSGVSPWTYLLNQTLMIVRYLRLTIWPVGLVVDYGVPRPLSVSDVAPSAALVVMLALSTVWMLVYRPKVGFLGLWFFTTLSPTSSIVPIATEVGAERRMYLPLAALVVLAVVGAAWALERWARTRGPAFAGAMPGPPELQRGPATRRAHAVGLVALAIVVLALSAGTVARNREFASSVSLARTTLDRWPNARARHSLGVALLAEGQREAGITELRRAVSEDPAALYTLGVALYQNEQLDEALQQLREFLSRESQRIEVPVAHELAGRILKRQGRFAEAAEEFRTVLRMTPSRIEVHGLLAESLFREQKFDEAIGHYQQFLTYRPADVPGHVQLGIAYDALGRQDDAIAQFRRVAALVPQDPVAHRNLARALLEKSNLKSNVDEAIVELRRAVELNPADDQVRAELEAVLRAVTAAPQEN
jgi:tetratricopeptide (TPR) repeat protein